jgi:hypothetical protein
VSELFNEVDEELRREQLKKLWDRYSGLVIVVAILIVAGVGGWRGYQYFQAKKAAENGAAFEAAVTLAEQGKHQEAEAAFAKIVTEGTPGYRGLARLRAASEAATRDPQEAVKLYDGIAADSSVGAAEQDIARVRAAALSLDTAPYDAIRQRLEAAAGAQRPYRHTARELLALSAWRANDTAAARQWLNVITDDPLTPSGMRSRMDALAALLPPAAKS